jgi:hypothetical protein
MSEDTIIAIEVIDTDYGEKVALQSPFEAKDFIKVLPFKEFSDEVSEHGSLRAKAVSRGMGEDNVAIAAVEEYVEEEGFSPDFAAYASWEPELFGPEDGGWVLDTDALDEAFDFFEFAGFETKNDTNL